MDKVSAVSSITPQITKSPKGYSWEQDGFSEQLNEAIYAADRKQASIENSDIKEKTDFSNSNIAQLINSDNIIKSSALANSHLSAGMINLYTAQERKNEKPNRTRLVEAAYAL